MFLMQASSVLKVGPLKAIQEPAHRSMSGLNMKTPLLFGACPAIEHLLTRPAYYVATYAKRKKVPKLLRQS